MKDSPIQEAIISQALQNKASFSLFFLSVCDFPSPHANNEETDTGRLIINVWNTGKR
jgi:hypothetical protein